MNLTALLKSLSEVQLELLVIAKQKEPIIIENRIEELNRLIRQESSLISKSRLLEQAIVTSAGSETLNAALKNTVEETSELQFIQADLLETVTELKIRNDVNQKLLSDSLAFVQGSLQLLQPNQDAGTYTKEAAAKLEGKALFDSKA
jgi:flagellar biosynthesis/type III secretory pathway chaperone